MEGARGINTLTSFLPSVLPWTVLARPNQKPGSKGQDREGWTVDLERQMEEIHYINKQHLFPSVPTFCSVSESSDFKYYILELATL